MLVSCSHAIKSSAETLVKVVHRLLLPAVVVKMLKLLVLVVIVGGASATKSDDDFLLDTISTSNERIIGGHVAKKDQFPYQVILRRRNTNFCGGSIIATRFILTAAQCTQGAFSKPSNFIVLGGPSFWFGFKEIPLDRIINHPKYIQRKLEYDISVLRTKRVIKFGSNIQLIPLPTVDVPPEGNVPAIVSGRGQNRVSSRVLAVTRFHFKKYIHFF